MFRKVVELHQDKITKTTVRYAEKAERPFQAYILQRELPKPFPLVLYITITEEKPQ